MFRSWRGVEVIDPEVGKLALRIHGVLWVIILMEVYTAHNFMSQSRKEPSLEVYLI